MKSVLDNNKKRKLEITFEPIKHEYFVKGHEDRTFTSCTTYIHENFYPTEDEFAINGQMSDAIAKKIKKTVEEFTRVKKDKKRKQAFLNDPENIRRVTKYALLDPEKCIRCSYPFLQEEMEVKYMVKQGYKEKAIYTERTEKANINRCGSCFNRFPIQFFGNEDDQIDMVDVAASWQISQEDGTILHAFIEDYLNGVFKTEDELNMACYATRGAIEFLKFYQVASPHMQIVHSEFRVASIKYGIAGTIDAVALVNGKKTIIDWKGVKLITEEKPFHKLAPPFDFFCPTKLGKYSTQIATYRCCYTEEFPDEDIERGMIVCFDPLKEGTFDVYELQGFKVFSLWIAECIDAFHNKQPLPLFTKQKEVYWIHVNRINSGLPVFATDDDWKI